MSKKYGLKAVNDEESICANCGKVELKQVMWLVELDSDGNEISNVFPVGTTCGAKMLKTGVSKMRTAAKNFEGEVNKIKWSLFWSHDNYKKSRQILDELNKLNLQFSERKIHPLYLEFKNLESAAWDWVNNQNIVVAL